MNYFLFTEGSYDEYGATGLYTTESSITLITWLKFRAAWQAQFDDYRHVLAKDMFPDVAGLEPRHYSISKDNKEYWDKVEQSTDSPKDKFIKLYNMSKVNYTELHGGG